MKRTLSLVVEVLVKLAACMATCIGCSSKGPPGEKPREIRWEGQDSGYETTTAVEPAERATGSTKLE